MTHTKNNSSIVKAVKGGEVIYLSARDEQNGLDLELDLKGYTVQAL